MPIGVVKIAVGPATAGAPWCGRATFGIPTARRSGAIPAAAVTMPKKPITTYIVSVAKPMLLYGISFRGISGSDSNSGRCTCCHV